ncbi:MAG: molybdopterin-synthase adenylyltransferase MoeB [Leptolyngbya sp.]|nr:molybdopterin-synthase adenylyltransferase MoeB [Candidatus Melainabacteria bacterium]
MANLPELSKSEITRYSRHLLLEEVGEEGQKRLKQARVLIIGMGGLGSPISLYLAAAGIGTIGIVDFDTVDLTNLQRQIVHSTESVGIKKTASASTRLKAVNPEINVVVHEQRFDAENALALLEKYDMVLDGTDNFQTRYLVNDACVLAGKPNVYGSIFRFEGQVSVFYAKEGPCYRCIYPIPPEANAVPNCAEAGVLGVLAGVIGSLQATEAIKLILGKGKSLLGKLLVYDALEMTFDRLNITKDPNCPVCGKNPTITSLKESEILCAAEEKLEEEISPTELAKLIEGGRKPFLLDVRSEMERNICHLEDSTLIPLPELEGRLSELDKDTNIVVYCHAGVRSYHAASFMRKNGFKNVSNLTGGITAWAMDVDKSMPIY